METLTKTLSVRIRDQHVPLLRQLAFEVNQVWNATNAESAEFSAVPIPGVGWMRFETSAFDLQKSLQGMRAERAPHLHSHTYLEVIAEHAKKRKQFKKNKLRWRCSGGSRRSLGWIPFKVGSAVWKNGQVRYHGHFFCSCCGTIPDSSPKGRAGLEVRHWECSCCGAKHDRDINAAINILNVGLGCQSQETTSNG
ncbi:hypothetical protein CCR95_21060 [Thiocystis minor]|nr:hypothetical protein [Thiocystis minor]